MMRLTQILILGLVLVGNTFLLGCAIHHKKPTDWVAERPLSKPEEITGHFADENRLGYYLFDHKAGGLNLMTCSISLRDGSTGVIAFQEKGKTVLEWPFTYAVKEGWLQAIPFSSQALPADNGIMAATKDTLWLRPNDNGGVAVKAVSRSAGIAMIVPIVADTYWFRLTRIN